MEHGLRYYLLFFVFFCSGHLLVQGQTDSTRHIVDELQFDLTKVVLDSNSNTLEIDLFVISYTEIQREFKANTYATQVLDDQAKPHFFASIQLGNVLVKFEDKQNYLHYLFEEDKPEMMTIRIKDWPGAKPETLKIVFESQDEEGSFISVAIPLRSN